MDHLSTFKLNRCSTWFDFYRTLGVVVSLWFSSVLSISHWINYSRKGSMFFLKLFWHYRPLDFWLNLIGWAAFVFRHMFLKLTIVMVCRATTTGQILIFIALVVNFHLLKELNITDCSCCSYCAVLTLRDNPKSHWQAVDNEFSTMTHYITWSCPQTKPWGLLHQWWVKGQVWSSREFLQASAPSPVIWSQTYHPLTFS